MSSFQFFPKTKACMQQNASTQKNPLFFQSAPTFFFFFGSSFELLENIWTLNIPNYTVTHLYTCSRFQNSTVPLWILAALTTRHIKCSSWKQVCNPCVFCGKVVNIFEWEKYDAQWKSRANDGPWLQYYIKNHGINENVFLEIRLWPCKL